MRFDRDDEIDAELEERLTRALESAPVLVISEDFAARVALRAAGQGVRSMGAAGRVRDSAGYGRMAVYAALPVLLVVMVLLARFAGSLSPITLGIEGLMVVEFVLVAVYLAMRPGVVRE